MKTLLLIIIINIIKIYKNTQTLATDESRKFKWIDKMS